MKKTWGTVSEATAILSEGAGRPIYETYVRVLARSGKIRVRKRDARTNEYHLGDCRAYHIRQNVRREPN